MKKIFTLAFSVVCALSVMQAQVTMTLSSHGLKPGDTHSSQLVEFKEPGMSGQGLVWDFSSLNPLEDADNSLVGTENNSEYNVGVTRGSDDIRFFYSNTELSNEYRGYKSGEFVVYYNQPMVKTVYPQTYGTAFNGSFEGTMSYNGKTTGNIAGTYSTQADATGTLLLPGNVTLPVLRVKTTERFTQWACGNTIVETEKYLWYAQDTRYPVFVSMITTTQNLGDKSVQATKRSYFNMNIEQPQLKTTKDPNAEIAYKISPNPFKDMIKISYVLPYEMKVSIDLYNAQGVKLTNIQPVQMQNGTQEITTNIAPYAQNEGIYFVKMVFGEKAYSEKIIK